MLRIIPCVMIAAVSLYIGYSLSSRLSRRESLLESFISLFGAATARISCSGDDLASAFSPDFADISFDSGRPFAPQWEELISSFADTLKDEDTDALTAFARGLGEGDAESQLRHIELYNRRLTDCRDAARRDRENKSKVYLAMPFAVGLTLIILLL